MEPLQINVVRDGMYLGITDGVKIVMIRDAFGVLQDVRFAHLVIVLESPITTAELLEPDFKLIKDALDASSETAK